MAHIKLEGWNGKGPRPCDWCGCKIDKPNVMIHAPGCPSCKRNCQAEESRFYVQLGYDGDSDVQLPYGYKVVIPKL